MTLKGMGYGCRTIEQVNSLKSLNLDWFYTWGQTPNEAKLPITGLPEFVPMLWSDSESRVASLPGNLAALNPRPTTILGFNEPDLAGQANMSPLQAINSWHHIKSTGLRMGGPANISTNTAWQERYMAGSRGLDVRKTEATKDYRIDFIAVHIYQNPHVGTFLNKVDAIRDRYGLPVWVTETAVHDFQATSKETNRYTREEVNEYMKELWSAIQTRPWLERFAWKTRDNEDPVGWPSSLFNSNGTRTSTGVTYANLT